MSPLRSNGARVTFAMLLAFFVGITVRWLYLDRAPPQWDDASYLTKSLVLFDALGQGGIGAYARQFNSLYTFRAPLIAALPTPFYLIFGRHWHAAFLVNLGSMLVLFAAIYRLGRKWRNARAGLLAVAMLGSMPLLYGLARWFMVEYVLTAVIALSVWLLVESEHLNRRPIAVLFGVLAGAGLLLKISYALFILFPFLYVWRQSSRRYHALAMVAVPCALLAAPWYALHLWPTVANAFDAGFGRSAVVQGTGPIFSIHSIQSYLGNVAKTGLSLYFTALALLLLLWLTVRPGGRRFLLDWARNTPLLLLWAMPFCVFLFGGNKDVRYIAPLLPAFALFVAAMLDFALPPGRVGTVLACLVLAFPMVDVLAVSFGVPFHSSDLEYARIFTMIGWPHDEILQDIAASAQFRVGEKPLIVIASDRGSFNADNFALAAAARQLPFRVETTANESRPNALQKSLENASFIVYKNGGEPESPLFNPHADEIVTRVGTDPRFVEIASGRRLPDGGIARIFKRRAPGSRITRGAFWPAGLGIPAEFAIDFGGFIELTGLSIDQTAESLKIKYRWRCRKIPDRDYWCFTHLLNADGKIAGQLDHPLMGGEPPAHAWQPGDEAMEEAQYRLPAQSSGKLRVLVGLYHPASRERLSISAVDDAVPARFTLVDKATALLAR